MNDEAYMVLSEGIPSLIDNALDKGATFDEAIAEIREQLEIAIVNRDEYEAL